MSQAKVGDRVKVHYTGKLNDGQIFDSSLDRNPTEFQIGGGKLIKGFESGVIDMEVGEKKTVKVSPDDGYGIRDETLVATIDRSQLPTDVNVSVGQALQIQQPNGQAIIVIITNVAEKTVTLDANHPLAGKTLIFDIELVEIV